jgi:hypothetical protein
MSVCSDLFLVLQTYLATITGPAFHALAPDSLCYLKPRLTTLTHYFNLLAEQYPSISAGLKELVANSATSADTAASAKHILEFFKFYLPLVCQTTRSDGCSTVLNCTSGLQLRCVPEIQ